MNSKKALVAAIVNFLKKEGESGDLDEDGKEGLEVAVQCLETAYNLDNMENNSEEVDLMEIYEVSTNKKSQKKSEPTELEKEKAENLKAEGNNLMKTNEINKAVFCYSQAIQLDPTNAVYYCNRAAAYTRQNENIKAIADCQKAVLIDPNYGKAYGRMGLVYLNEKNYEKAVKNYRKAVSLEPNNTSYKNYLQTAQESLEASQSHTSSNGVNEPTAQNPLANMDLGSLLSNPAVMNMAQNFMQNPQLQNMFSSMMGAGMPGVSSPGSSTPNASTSSAAGEQTGTAGSGFQMPQGLDFSNIMNATQQFAEEMRQQNPEMVENLRAQFQGSQQHRNDNESQESSPDDQAKR